MKPALTTILNALEVSTFAATAAMVYTHDKELKAKTATELEILKLQKEDFKLRAEQLEIDKFKLNPPSKFDKTIAVNPDGDTQLTSKSIVDEIFNPPSPFELNTFMDNPQTMKLAALAILLATIGILLTNSIILFNLFGKEYINRKTLKYPNNSLLRKINNFYSRYSGISTTLLLSFLFYYFSLLTFIGFYILLFI